MRLHRLHVLVDAYYHSKLTGMLPVHKSPKLTSVTIKMKHGFNGLW